MKLKKNESGIWVVTIETRHGKRTLSTKLTNLEDAKRAIRQAKVAELEQAARVGALNAQTISVLTHGRKVTIDEILEEFREWRTKTRKSSRTTGNCAVFVGQWIREMGIGKLTPESVTEKHIDPWINPNRKHKLKSSVKVGTLKNRLWAVDSFFVYCNAKGYTNGNPARLVAIDYSLLDHEQKETRKRRPFTNEQLDFIMAHTKPSFWYFLVGFSRWTGLRLGDICRMEWAALADEVVWLDKTDRRLPVPLSPEVIDLIAEIPRVHKKYCFPEEREIFINPKMRSKLSTYFSRVLEKLNIEGHSFHDIRATFATELYKDGENLRVVGDRLGHRSTDTTQLYVREA